MHHVPTLLEEFLARVKLNIQLKNIVLIYNSREKFYFGYVSYINVNIFTMQAIIFSDKGVKPLLIRQKLNLLFFFFT